ncbi:unnamed protein product, partial [Allacma fusca]
MTDEVASEFNWAGHNGKISFRNYELCTIITNAVHFHFGKSKGTVHAIQDSIKLWLKAAPQRLKRGRSKE